MEFLSSLKFQYNNQQQQVLLRVYLLHTEALLIDSTGDLCEQSSDETHSAVLQCLLCTGTGTPFQSRMRRYCSCLEASVGVPEEHKSDSCSGRWNIKEADQRQRGQRILVGLFMPK